MTTLTLSVAAHLLVPLFLHDARGRAHSAETYRDVWSSRSIEVGVVVTTSADSAQGLTSPHETSPSEANPSVPATGENAPAERGAEFDHAAPAPRPRARSAQPSVKPAARKKPPLEAVASGARAAPRTASATLSPTESDLAIHPASAGALGATNLPLGIRHFATAFTRALPAANYADADWTDLPAGRVGEGVVEVQIDTDGRIEEVQWRRGAALPPVLWRTVERAILLLRAGTFSLDPKHVRAGKERLGLAASISEGTANSDPSASSRHLQNVGYEAPTQERVGYARFSLNSGRRVEISVRFAEPKRP